MRGRFGFAIEHLQRLEENENKNKVNPKVKQFPETSDRKRNPRMPEKQTHWQEKETLSHSAVTTWTGKTSFLLQLVEKTMYPLGATLSHFPTCRP